MDYEESKKRKIGINWVLLIGFVCLTFLLTIQSVNSPISKKYAYSDYSVYQYIAQIMSEGGMPYRDTFDHKGPVFYLVNELGYMIHPKYGMWIIDFLLMFGAVVYAYKISNKVLDRKMSFFVVAAVMSGIPAWGYWIGNTPESCILFFLMMTMYLFTEYIDCKTLSNKQILLVSISTVFAMMTKPTFLVMFFVLVMGVLYDTVKRKDFIYLKRCLILFLTTFFGLTALIVLWLGVNEAFSDCIDQYVIFNTMYSSATKNSILTASYDFLERPSTILGIFCIWINFMRWNKYGNKTKHLLISVYLAWILVFYMSVIPGRGYQQYTILYYPMILVIVSYALKDLDKWLKESNYKKIEGIIIVVLIVSNIMIPNIKEIVANIRNYTAEEEKVKVEVVDYIQNIPGEYEISVVTPDDNWVYLQTGRHSATKYSYTQADLIYENIQSDFIKEYSSEINSNHPKFIIEHCRSMLYTNKISANIQLKYEEVFRNDSYIVYELSEI